MKRKILFLVGLGTGYVMGTRAGRARYDKLAATTKRFWNDPRVTKVRDDVEGYARSQAPIIRERAEAVAKAAPGAVAGAAREVADATTATAKDLADKTTMAAKDVADKAAAAAKDIADRTTATARSVAGRVTGVADDVKDQFAKTATGLKDRGEDAVERVTLSMSEARDRTLEDDSDENDDDAPRS